MYLFPKKSQIKKREFSISHNYTVCDVVIWRKDETKSLFVLFEFHWKHIGGL